MRRAPSVAAAISRDQRRHVLRLVLDGDDQGKCNRLIPTSLVCWRAFSGQCAGLIQGRPNKATGPGRDMSESQQKPNRDHRPWSAAGRWSLLFLICLIAWLPGLFTIPPLDRDESRFAQASKQMLETGNFVDIRFGHEPRYKKPVGIYWLQAASTAVAAHRARRARSDLDLSHAVAAGRARCGGARLSGARAPFSASKASFLERAAAGLTSCCCRRKRRSPRPTRCCWPRSWARRRVLLRAYLARDPGAHARSRSGLAMLGWARLRARHSDQGAGDRRRSAA